MRPAATLFVIGRVPTPVLYHTVVHQPVDGGVMITGSHQSGRITTVLRSVSAADAFRRADSGSGKSLFRRIFRGAGTPRILVVDDYEKRHLSKINARRPKIKSVVDVAATAWAASRPCRSIGVRMRSSSSFSPSPIRISRNHHPDPTVTEYCRTAIGRSRKRRGFRLAFDGDGDRLGLVDETGRIIWGDELMILLSREILRDNPGATIIAEVKCSRNLFEDIARHGGRALMWKAGHSIIKRK
jgi:phosphomannomutase/phosphoglucomutase